MGTFLTVLGMSGFIISGVFLFRKDHRKKGFIILFISVFIYFIGGSLNQEGESSLTREIKQVQAR